MSPARRGGTSDQARSYRQQGHDDALQFAQCLGLDEDYRNDKQAKKDVIDPSGDAHSVKSGQKKWQIFLYRRSRFENDDGFQALNGVGSLLIHCIDAFPPRYQDYRGNERAAKERLRTPMRELKDRFQRRALLRAFLMKSIFNGGEVNYLTIKHEDRFHIYHNQDVVQMMGEAFVVENSVARKDGDLPEQKVLFKCDGNNVGELEMRNDSPSHYGEVRFNMIKDRCVNLLRNYAPDPFQTTCYSKDVVVYGKAVRTFGNWKQGWKKDS